jgi:hypothetical protein
MMFEMFSKSLHSLSGDRQKIEVSTDTCKRVEQSFPLFNLWAPVLPWCLQPPQILRLISNHQSPLGRYLGGGAVDWWFSCSCHSCIVGLIRAILSPSPLFFFSVEVKKYGVFGRWWIRTIFQTIFQTRPRRFCNSLIQENLNGVNIR